MKRKSVNTVKALVIMGVLLGTINMTACGKTEVQDDVIVIAESEETQGEEETPGEEEFKQLMKNEEFQKRMIMTMNRIRMEQLTKPMHIGKFGKIF